MIHFIRLTRPLNIAVVVMTMYGLGWYLESNLIGSFDAGVKSIEFFILVFSTSLIAAAGNIINDYFDMRADRINKPERMIIGKYVKRRLAILTHWIINIIAFGMAIYLSYKLNTFWYLFIHLLSINILWFYSTYFKRKLLIGNLLVASLTALVPLLVGLYYYHHDGLIWDSFSTIFPFNWFDSHIYIVYLSVGLAVFAFLLNLAREIIKDIQDTEGDKVLRAKTLPLMIGDLKSKWIAAFILTISLIGISFVFIKFPLVDGPAMLTLFIALFFIVMAIVLTIVAQSKNQYRNINLCIKIAMIFGTFSPIYWQLLQLYAR